MSSSQSEVQKPGVTDTVITCITLLVIGALATSLGAYSLFDRTVTAIHNGKSGLPFSEGVAPVLCIFMGTILLVLAVMVERRIKR